MQIGAQLYTAHQRTQTLEDFANTLERVSQIGYRAVQVSGTCPYQPQWLREQLEKNGLVCAMTHVAPQRILEEPEVLVREHGIFHCRHIGIGGIPGPLRGSLEGYEEFRKQFLPAALRIRDAGGKMMYHNHWFEFDKLDGKNVLERILEDFPEDSIDFTLDIGWAAFAGEDVLALIDMLKGRISRVHLKDYADMPKDGSITTPAYLRPVYEGKLDYDAYIRALEAAGTQFMLVEQDDCYDEDEFECLARSFDHVTSRFPECR